MEAVVPAEGGGGGHLPDPCESVRGAVVHGQEVRMPAVV